MVIRAYIKKADDAQKGDAETDEVDDVPTAQSQMDTSITDSEKSIQYIREIHPNQENDTVSDENFAIPDGNHTAVCKEEGNLDENNKNDSRQPSEPPLWKSAVELSKTNFISTFHCKTPNEDGEMVTNRDLRQVFILMF